MTSIGVILILDVILQSLLDGPLLKAVLHAPKAGKLLLLDHRKLLHVLHLNQMPVRLLLQFKYGRRVIGMIGCLGMMGYMGYHFDWPFFLSSSILARLSFSSWAARALELSWPFSKGAKGMRLLCQVLYYFSSAGVSSFAADSAVTSPAGFADAAGFAGAAGSASAADSDLAGLVLAAGFSGYSSSSFAAGFLVLAALGSGSSYLAGALDGAAFLGGSSSSSSTLAGFFCS